MFRAINSKVDTIWSFLVEVEVFGTRWMNVTGTRGAGDLCHIRRSLFRKRQWDDRELCKFS